MAFSRLSCAFLAAVLLCFAPQAIAAGAKPHKNILFIMTSNGELFGSGRKTGVWLDNLAIPYYAFTKAGYGVAMASTNGLRPPIDPRSEKEAGPAGKAFLADAAAMKMFSDTIPINEIKPEGFDAVFMPGGHGMMWDHLDSAALRQPLYYFVNNKKLIVALDHGSMALLGLKGGNGEEFVKGRKMAAFARAEETRLDLLSCVPSYPDMSLENAGAKLSRAAPFKPMAVQDANLITGQNPQSAEKVTQLALKALAKQ